jgi:hypothetical protein
MMDYLSSPATLDPLIKAGALEGSDPGELTGKTLQIDWDKAIMEFDAFRSYLDFIFVRS